MKRGSYDLVQIAAPLTSSTGAPQTGMMPSFSLLFVSCKYTPPVGNGCAMMCEPSTNGILVNFREMQIVFTVCFLCRRDWLPRTCINCLREEK